MSVNQGDQLLHKVSAANKTISFDEIDDDEGGNNDVYQARMVDISPPPGMDWEVHLIEVSYTARPRNPTDEEPAVSIFVPVSLTYGDELWEDFDEGEPYRWVGAFTEDKPVNSYLEFEDDELLAFTIDQSVYAFSNEGTFADADAVHGVDPAEGVLVHDSSDDPIHLHSREEISVFMGSDYPASNTIGGGERTIFLSATVDVWYRPKPL